jgi:transposase InsO family protein
VVISKYQGLKGDLLEAYQDDISAGSETAQKHIEEVRRTLQRTKEANLRMQLQKCVFGKTKANILGHLVSFGKILPRQEHQNTIANFREPKCSADLLQFLGVLNFVGEFIGDSSSRMTPLYEVLVGTGWKKKKKKRDRVYIPHWESKWNEKPRTAFETLRDELTSPEFVAPIRSGAKKKLVTDASKYGLGVVLIQEEQVGKWLPVAFGSLKLKGAEVRYTTTEKECMAVVFGLHKYRHLLCGEIFKVVTDHTALKWLMSLRDPRDRLAHWMIEVMQFDFAVEYSPGDGTLIAVPDALSRDAMDRDIVLCQKKVGGARGGEITGGIRRSPRQRHSRQFRGVYNRRDIAGPVKDESAKSIGQILLNRWILQFGPLEKLLSDRGKVFMGDVIRHLCEQVGTKKIFTSAYHPQTDGCVERFSRTLCNDIAKFILDESDWDQHVCMSTFRYNTSVHRATGISPYRAMFGVDVFEFDAGVGLKLRLDDEPQDLAERLSAVHRDLLTAGRRSRTSAAKYYEQAVMETRFKIGDRALIYHPPGDAEVGRKLRVPWIGPYSITDKHSPVSYSLKSEIDGKSARAHVNRLRSGSRIARRNVRARRPMVGPTAPASHHHGMSHNERRWRAIPSQACRPCRVQVG